MNLPTDCIYILLPFLDNLDKYSLLVANKYVLQYIYKQQSLTIETSKPTIKHLIAFYKRIQKLVIIIDNYDYKFINQICKLKFNYLKHVEFIPKYKYESDLSIYLNKLNNLNIDYCLLNNSLKCFILNHPKIEIIKIENSSSISDFTVLLLIKTCIKLQSCKLINCTRLTDLSLNIVNQHFIS